MTNQGNHNPSPDERPVLSPEQTLSQRLRQAADDYPYDWPRVLLLEASAALAAKDAEVARVTKERDAAAAHAREASMEERELRAEVASLRAQLTVKDGTINQLGDILADAYSRIAETTGQPEWNQQRKGSSNTLE